MMDWWKSERIENILISLLFVWLRVKKWMDGKKKKFAKTYSHTLIKKWCPIKTKIWQTKEKKNHPNLLKNNNHVKKKKITSSFTKKKPKNKKQIKSNHCQPTPKKKKKGKVSQESKR